METPSFEQLAINSIRTLSIDAVEQTVPRTAEGVDPTSIARFSRAYISSF